MDQVGKLQHVKVASLKHYAKNRKQHSKEQIERLSKLIEAHGFRDPLIVDQDTMEVLAGNGTLMAVKLLGWETVPCVMQTFESDEQRYAFSVSHNAIQAWDPIDLSAIHKDLPDLDGFDLDLLGIKDFQFEPVQMVNKGNEMDEWAQGMPDFKEGDNYIKLVYFFASEKDREDYVNKNNVEVKTKRSKYSWLVYP